MRLPHRRILCAAVDSNLRKVHPDEMSTVISTAVAKAACWLALPCNPSIYDDDLMMITLNITLSVQPTPDLFQTNLCCNPKWCKGGNLPLQLSVGTKRIKSKIQDGIMSPIRLSLPPSVVLAWCISETLRCWNLAGDLTFPDRSCFLSEDKTEPTGVCFTCEVPGRISLVCAFLLKIAEQQVAELL